MKKPRTLLIIALTLFSFITLTTSCAHSPADFVNPMVGTDEHGHTFPGAIVPFGQIQPGPDTRQSGWDGCSGYHYSDDTIYGFSHTHLNGTGCEDYGDIMLMPYPTDEGFDCGEFLQKGYADHFDHKNEVAEPGYYKVLLDGTKTTVELTTTERVAMHRYTFGKNCEKVIVIDLNHRDKLVEGYIRYDGKTITGYRNSKAWNPDQSVYFAMKCDNITGVDFLADSTLAVIYIGSDSPVVEAQVAISSVDEEGAMKNLKTAEGMTFDQVKNQAREQWNQELSKIEINGGSKEQKRTFYTALYHCMTSPYLYSDADGRYRGMDKEIHQTDGKHQMYTVFSLWDTYRALHPLLNMIDKKRSEDFIYSMLRQYEQGGELTMWELWGHETRCMIGYHACPVILDAAINGIIDDWSIEEKTKLLEGMIATANMDALGRREYARDGFLSSELDNESVSKTLEYAYDDWCIAQYAKWVDGQRTTVDGQQSMEMDLDGIYDEYMLRSQSWKNIMDENGFMHARRNGGWLTPFDPTEVNNNYTEGNCWQYSSYVPHDLLGWAEMIGGTDKAIEFLDSLFLGSSNMTGREQVDITGVIGQYAHGNEPSHHAAYLYTYFGQPEKTRELVHKICNELYTSAPDGDCGNEDCGQMGAWYVLSSIGMYPVCPGSGDFVTTEPIFGQITMHIDGQEPLVIDRKKWPQGKYWNKGQFYDEPVKFDHRAITQVPLFNDWQMSFAGTQKMTIANRKGDKIYYTIDGTPPDSNATLYNGPIEVNNDCTIKAVAYNPQSGYSKMVEHQMIKFEEDKTISYLIEPAPQYSEGGAKALINRLHGTSNYRIGGWQGWQTDMEVVIDLLDNKTIRSIDCGFLRDMKSWIFLPKGMVVEISNDGKTYTPYGNIENTKPALKEEEEIPTVEHLTIHGNARGRYIKVRCINYGPLPQWHVSPGEPAWLFVDEVSVDCAH